MKGYLRKAVLAALALTTTGVLSAQGAFNENLQTYTLDEVVVYGMGVNPKYSGDYIVRKTELGSLGNVDFMDVPVAVQSFSNKTIQTQASPGNTVLEVLTMAPSTTSRGEKTYNDVSIRGFYVSPHDFYLNGVSGILSQSSIPMNFVERVEVTYGPSTLFYGVPSNGSIGAAVNLVPKKATVKPLVEWKETFSGKGHWEHAFDVGRRFGKNAEWGLRVNIDYGKGSTERNTETMESGNAFINLDHATDKSLTEFLYGYRYVDQFAPTLPLYLNNHDLPKAPSGEANFQLPWSRYRYNNNMMALSHVQKLGKTWEWFLKAGYHDEDWNMCMESYWPTLIDDKGNFKAELEDVPIRFWRTSFMTGLRGEVATDSGIHHLTFSADKMWTNGGGQDWFPEGVAFKGNIYNHDIENPAYVQPKKELEPWYYSGATTLSGISFTDRWVSKDQKLTLLAGIRHQKDLAYKNHDPKQGGYKTRLSASKTLPSFGALFKIDETTAVYANYIKGMSRGTFVRANFLNKGDYLPPKETKQYEAGIKKDWGNHGLILSAFSLEQERTEIVPVLGETKPKLQYGGKQKNTGIELTTFGKWNDRLSWYGGIMYMKGKYEDGGVVPAMPKWRMTMAADYEWSDRLTLSGRLQFTGKAALLKTDDKHVPSWTRLDLGATYAFGDLEKPVEFSLNIYNVLNRKYWYASSTDSVYLGAPRSVVASLRYHF